MKQLYLLLFLASVPMVAMFEDYTAQKEAEEAYVAPKVTFAGSRHTKKEKASKASQEKRRYWLPGSEGKLVYNSEGGIEPAPGYHWGNCEPQNIRRSCPEGVSRMAGSTGIRTSAGRVMGQRQEKITGEKKYSNYWPERQKPQRVLPLTQEEVARIGRESVSNMEKWQEYYRNNN